MPTSFSARFDNPLSNNDVVIKRCASGSVAGCFNPCPHSEEINSTRTTGDGAGTAVQVEPTGTARANAAANFLSLADLASQALSEDYSLYRSMWSDLNRCGNLPSSLSSRQRHSLYEQMACHALYGVSTRFGGNTWDFEAWRDDVDWAEALSFNGRCGQRYGDQPAAAEFLQGTLVKAFDTHASTLAAQTWLVANLNGVNVMRNVASSRGYGCLLAKGKAVARWLPSSFLDEYLAGRAPDVSDDEACGTSSTGGSSGGSAQVTLAQGPSAPQGYWYAVTLNGFGANQLVSVSCRDSVDPSGFRSFSAATDASGHAVADNGCYSGDGPDHWAMAGGVESNHVSWGSGGSGGTVGQPVNAYDNYGGGAVGHAMCRGNPGRPESMPGGTASQAFSVPAGVAAIDHALVQIDPDSSVTAHATLSVNGSAAASADAAASGDTSFAFSRVNVRQGDTVSLSISFTASSGKIITVYTVGSPGGTFTASNSCSDGAPNVSTPTTGLRAVVSGYGA
jgi:hypothetical protein